jgi:hypothetical protein
MNLEGLMPKHNKVASAQPSNKVAAAVEEAAASVARSHVKTAGVTPMASIEKLASELAAQDQDTSIKTAHVVGAAMADGFMSQLGMYEKVAAQISEKTAAYQVPAGAGLDPSTVELVKIAQEDPAAFLSLVKEASGEEEMILKQAEDEAAAQLERNILHKSAEHWLAGYEVGRLLVAG